MYYKGAKAALVVYDITQYVIVTLVDLSLIGNIHQSKRMGK